MTIGQEIALSLAIALGAALVLKMIWSVLAFAF